MFLRADSHSSALLVGPSKEEEKEEEGRIIFKFFRIYRRIEGLGVTKHN